MPFSFINFKKTKNKLLNTKNVFYGILDKVGIYIGKILQKEQRNMRKLLSVITAVIIAVSFIEVPVSAASLKLSRSKVDLPIDYYTTLTVKGAKGKVEWSSEDSEIASAEPFSSNSADIIGKKTGETYIYAKADGKTLKCRVKVKPAFISVSSENMELGPEDSKTVRISVIGPKKICIKNSDKSVCSVTYGKWNGNTVDLTVKAGNEGTAALSIYAENYFDSTAVSVNVSVDGGETILRDDDPQENSASDADKEPDVKPLSGKRPRAKSGDYEKYCYGMKKVIENYSHDCEILIYSPEYGRLFSHNTKKYVMGASTIKLPYVYYCCTQIEQGKHSLDEKVVYKEEHYYGGMGKVQYSEFGSEWTIRTLIDYTLRYSDNAAYFMLMSVFGKDGFNEMVKEWGYSSQLGVRNYPDVNAEFMKTAMLKMKKRSSDGECWSIAWNALLKSVQVEARKELKGRDVAIKCGTTNGYYHEVCYVDGEIPYVLIIMTEVDGKTKDEAFVRNIANIADNIVWSAPARKT